MQIGEFSQLSGLSVRMLRHYDEIGLLPPAACDAATGYRRYEAAQLQEAHRIKALKSLGLTLDQVHRLLNDELTVEELSGMLKMESERARSERNEAQRRLDELQRQLVDVRLDGRLNEVDLIERSVPAAPFLAVRLVAADLSEAMDVVGQVVEASVAEGIEGPVTVVSHVSSFIDTDLDMSVGFDRSGLTGPLSVGGLVLEERELPAVERMITAVHHGEHEVGHRLSHLAIARWLEHHNAELVGGAREIIHHPASLATGSGTVEIQFPVAGAAI